MDIRAMQNGKSLAILLTVASLAGALGTGCDNPADTPKPNQLPEVYLSSGPPNGDPNVNYKVHFYWNGYDPDGAVSHFEYLVTNDNVTGPILIDDSVYQTLADLDAAYPAVDYRWHKIEVHDTILSVRADSIPYGSDAADSLYFYGDDRFLFRAHHTFFLRAVDEHGAVSARPAYRTFTATTIAPVAKIEHPSDVGNVGGYDNMPQDIFFRWAGVDSVGDGTVIEPDSTRFVTLRKGDYGLDTQFSGRMINLPDSIWSSWRHWEAVDSLNDNVGGKRTLITGLTPISAGQGQGEYLFMVQAMDEAGAITSHYEDGKNLRKLRIVSSLQPTIAISEDILGVRVSSSDQTFDFTIAERQPLNLTWSANADSYGSEITGMRFGWDILDTANDDEWSSWSLSKTSSSNSFVSGSHTFYLEARDYSGYTTQVLYRLFVVPFTMDRDLLFIDDYSNLASSDPDQSWPDGEDFAFGTYYLPDEAQRTFWNAILMEYGGYDPVVDFFKVSVVEPKPPFQRVASYKRLIWEVKEEQAGESGLAEVSRFVDTYVVNQVPFDYLAAFMDRGGHALICGSQPVFAMLPMITEMGSATYERKSPMAFLKHLGYSQGGPGESAAAVQRFLPWSHFGVDAVVKPVDQTAKNYTWTRADFITFRIFWGLAGMGYPGDELDRFPISSDWAPADTLRFRPDVYQWLADAGAVFMEQAINRVPPRVDCDLFDCVNPPPLFGTDMVEIYNWDFFATKFTPNLVYRQNMFIPLLTYRPADDTTRWGSNPTNVHTALTDDGENFDELNYSMGGAGEHAIAVIGLRNPETPSVLMGMVPYYLAEDEAQGFIDHVLIDIFNMVK